MAEVILMYLIDRDPELKGHVVVTSAGNARWHVTSPMDQRTRRALDRAGFHLAGTLGAFADAAYLERQDLVMVMTREHRYDVHQRLKNATPEVLMWRNLLELGLDLDVADPYYESDDSFDDCDELFIAGGQRLTSVFRQQWDERSHEV